MRDPRRPVLPFVLVAVAAAAALGGCSVFEEPPIEDLWTRVDLEAPRFLPASPLSPGAPCSVEVRTTITYRAILTGFSVTELRASPVSPTAMALALDGPREAMAQRIDSLLTGSVSTGRFVRPVTGWHHLIQPIDVSFGAFVPSALDTSLGSGPVYVYLVSYLGSGEEIELPGGEDSIAVTPFLSEPMQILPVGMPVPVSP